MRRGAARWAVAAAVTLAPLATSATSARAADRPAPLEYPPAACEAPADEAVARAAFVAAKAAYDVAEYELAVARFHESYASDCRRHGLLPILASAYEKQGDYPGALVALRLYVQREPSAEDRELVLGKIANLERRVDAQRRSEAARSRPPPVASPAPAQKLERRGHTVAPWVVVGVGVAGALVGAVLFPVGLASNDGVVARDALGNPLLEGGETVTQRCATFGGACVANVGGDPGRPTQDPRFAISEQAARDQTHPATQAALAARDKAVAGLVVGGVGLLAIGVGLLWHTTEPTGFFAKTLARAPAVRPVLGPGVYGGGVGGVF
jgi:tetratricopeptide (TPR) repeat protein